MVCEMNHSASKSFIQVPELVLEAAAIPTLRTKAPDRQQAQLGLGKQVLKLMCHKEILEQGAATT